MNAKLLVPPPPPPSAPNFQSLTTLKLFFLFSQHSSRLPFGLILCRPQLQTAIGDSLQGRRADESFSLCYRSLIHMQITFAWPKLRPLIASLKCVYTWHALEHPCNTRAGDMSSIVTWNALLATLYRKIFFLNVLLCLFFFTVGKCE